MVDYSKLKLIEICDMIVQNESHVDWRDILDAFGFDGLFNKYPRLTRSQKWGDPDYNTNVKNIIFDSINKDEVQAFKMIDYILKNCTYCDEEEISKVLDEISGKKSYLNLDKTTYEELNDLIDNINESIASGKPVFALDKLHLLIQKYIKALCLKHNSNFDDDDRLDELFKKYVNTIKVYLDSKMTLSILKSNISLFSQYNNVRNNHTYAHDNNVLGDIESELIFNNIVNVKKFIDDLEEIIWN